MNVLITGANGLIGAAVRRHVPPSTQVFAVVRPDGGAPLERPGVGHERVVRADLGTTIDERSLPDRIDGVVHLAQSRNFRSFPEKALDIFGVNVASTQHLLDLARRRGARWFILASSGGVYAAGAGARREESPLAAPRDLGFYLTSKLCAELLAEPYAPHFSVTVLRFFFAYGPDQNETMLLPRLVRSVAAGREVALHGEDGIALNPIHVDDAARAVVAAMALEGRHTINVAGAEVVRIRTLAERVGRALGTDPIFQSSAAPDNRDLVACIEQMTERLVAPRVTLDSGIAELVRAFRAEASVTATR